MTCGSRWKVMLQGLKYAALEWQMSWDESCPQQHSYVALQIALRAEAPGWQGMHVTAEEGSTQYVETPHINGINSHKCLSRNHLFTVATPRDSWYASK